MQIISDNGALKFGTEVISPRDGSIAALLGASPGASTAVSIMLEVIEKCFPQYVNEWEPKIKEMVPSYGMSLTANPELAQEIETDAVATLGLKDACTLQEA